MGSDGYTISEPEASSQFTDGVAEDSGAPSSDLSASAEDEVDEDEDDLNANVDVSDGRAVTCKSTSPNGLSLGAATSPETDRVRLQRPGKIPMIFLSGFSLTDSLDFTFKNKSIFASPCSSRQEF